MLPSFVCAAAAAAADDQPTDLSDRALPAFTYSLTHELLRLVSLVNSSAAIEMALIGLSILLENTVSSRYEIGVMCNVPTLSIIFRELNRPLFRQEWAKAK